MLADSLRMFRHELDRFQDGLFFYYFSSVDQNSHMLWGRYDDDLLEIYRDVDSRHRRGDAEGGKRHAPAGDFSDHGFARFNRAVHLNTFLMREGFLALDDPAKTGDDELFAHVDWGKTLAYAIGLNGVYLNLEGREDGGIVPEADKRRSWTGRGAAQRVQGPATGEKVVDTVYFPETAFQGRI